MLPLLLACTVVLPEAWKVTTDEGVTLDHLRADVLEVVPKQGPRWQVKTSRPLFEHQVRVLRDGAMLLVADDRLHVWRPGLPPLDADPLAQLTPREQRQRRLFRRYDDWLESVRDEQYRLALRVSGVEMQLDLSSGLLTRWPPKPPPALAGLSAEQLADEALVADDPVPALSALIKLALSGEDALRQLVRYEKSVPVPVAARLGELKRFMGDDHENDRALFEAALRFAPLEVARDIGQHVLHAKQLDVSLAMTVKEKFPDLSSLDPAVPFSRE